MMELWVKCEMLTGISGILGRWSGVDPGFEIGGCQNTRVSAQIFFQCHKSTTMFGHLRIVITNDINKHEVVENYNFEALCGHCC